MTEEHENLISVPPDGGWGWVIVLVSCYSMFIADVPALGFQVIEDELMELLGLTAAEVSIFFSTYIAFMFLMGPIAGGVCNRFGFRMTNMLGCFLMILGLVSSYFISDYFSFLLFYGITCGCGTSFILMVANVATGFWFDSKRTIAFGLVSASGGISVFSVPLSNYLADEYGWRHCFSIWAGLVVILLLGSFLLAPPPMIELESNKPLVGPANTVDIKRVTIIIPLEYEKPKVQRMTAKKIHKMSMTTGIPMGRVSRASVRPAREPIGLGKIFRCCLCCNCCTQSVGSRPLYRKDIFYEGSICYAAKKENQDETTFPLTMTKLPTTRDVAQEVECHCALPEAVSRALKEMLDFSLFKSPIFFLILLSSFVVYIVRYIPLLVLKKFNLPYMDNVTANKVITMFGLGSLISRALVGFILYYFHHISPLIATIFVTLIGGMALCCLIITHWEIYQMVLSFVAGSFVAVVISIRSLVIIDLLGLNKLTSCTGLLFFLQGFASFVGMPIAEILREKTGSHRASIIFSAAGYILAGFFNIILLFVDLRRKHSRTV